MIDSVQRAVKGIPPVSCHDGSVVCRIPAAPVASAPGLGHATDQRAGSGCPHPRPWPARAAILHRDVSMETIGSMKTIGIGVIGLGFMGRTHIEAIDAAVARGATCRLAAVCDADAGRLDGLSAADGIMATVTGASDRKRLFDPTAVVTTTDPAVLFRNPDVDLVHICTWTDTHIDLAVAALRAGKHVVVEKPVAHTSEEVAHLARVAEDAGRLCMPAMVMRFWPEWRWLRDRIRDGRLGQLRSLVLTRLGAMPSWTRFYKDEERSGGALIDLHVHDADFITWCFGQPESVSSNGTSQHITSCYRYAHASPAPRHLVAEGGWGLDPAAGFRMRFVACFEKATADFELGRAQPLMLYATADGRASATAVEIQGENAYHAEVAAAIHAVATGDHSGTPTIEESITVMRLLEAEYRSIHTGTAERVLCRRR